MPKPPLSVPTPALLPHPKPKQLSIAFDAIQLQALNRSERTKVLSCLAHLLLQAAGVATKECDDDKH
jgi:hypothetical protein